MGSHCVNIVGSSPTTAVGEKGLDGVPEMVRYFDTEDCILASNLSMFRIKCVISILILTVFV